MHPCISLRRWDDAGAMIWRAAQAKARPRLPQQDTEARDQRQRQSTHKKTQKRNADGYLIRSEGAVIRRADSWTCSCL
eukprot:scaffold12105_cov101-Isochrysis_galbana.AAC.1